MILAKFHLLGNIVWGSQGFEFRQFGMFASHISNKNCINQLDLKVDNNCIWKPLEHDLKINI